MDELIEKFHKSDSRWTIWGADTYDNFIKMFMIIGKFHKDVPQKIIDDFQVVERLMCYSYYYYPLIDEAFSKSMRVFESAVKLKLANLGLENENKFETLDKKIKRIEKYTSPQVYKEWEKARRVRNIFAHPIAGSVMGITVINAFFQTINIINTLFLDRQTIEDNELTLERLKTESKHFKDDLLIFEFENQPILIWSILPHSCFVKNDTLNSFWVFHPVLIDFPQSVENLNFTHPICLRLKNVEMKPKEFSAINLSTGKEIKAIKTTKPDNILKLRKYKDLIVSADHKVKEIYWDYLESELTTEVVKFLYYECWD
jgi:hypothetical protein